MFKLDVQHTEKISPKTSTPDTLLPCKTRIADSRDNLIAYKQDSNAKISIYTDGSGYKGGMGTASVMYIDKTKEPINILRYHLGKMDQHSTYEAEVVGLMLAVWQIKTLGSQSAITSTTAERSKLGQYLYNNIHNIANSICNRGTHPIKFQINWISAHSSVEGNKQVNQEAKAAAQGLSTPCPWLLHALHKVLPTSVLALRQKAKTTRQENWIATWDESPRKEKMGLVNDEFPFKSYYKLTNKVDRNSMSLLIQL